MSATVGLGRAGVFSPEEDEALMAEALAVGQLGLGRTWPNPSVGAVVVRPTSAGPQILGRAAPRPPAVPMRSRWRWRRRATRPAGRRSMSRWSPARISAARRPARMR